MQLPVTCQLCGAAQPWQPIEHLAEPCSDLYHCARCDGQFWWPAVNPGPDWYESTYAGRNEDPVQHLGWNHYQFLDAPLERGTLLDVGCGIGHFMAVARDRGWQVWGLDFDQNAVRVAREYYGITTIDADSAEQYRQRNPSRQFNAVTAFEVLEHMEDPQAFIRDIHALVQPGGYVGISVPYRNAPKWIRPHDFPPRHLTRWNRTAMANFLTSHGFKVLHQGRCAVTLERLLMRFKFAAGRFGSMGALAMAKTKMGAVAGNPSIHPPAKLRWLRRAARLKDWLLFGVPAISYWVYLWVTRSHYDAMYVLAQKT